MTLPPGASHAIMAAATMLAPQIVAGYLAVRSGQGRSPRDGSELRVPRSGDLS